MCLKCALANYALTGFVCESRLFRTSNNCVWLNHIVFHLNMRPWFILAPSPDKKKTKIEFLLLHTITKTLIS